MLIEAALRAARQAQTAWRAKSDDIGDHAVGRCREILCELIGSIRQGETTTADRVLGLYLFLFTSLTTAQASRDLQPLSGIIRVLEEEQETWREICLQLPDRQVATPSLANPEELAPSRVDSGLSFAPLAAHATSTVAAEAFSIDA
jgi:flagellin-specific chaperone FliS